MIMKVLAYRDTKLNVYTQPFFLDGDRKNEDIIEIIRRMCAAPTMPVQYFEYDLYLIGEYDDKLGAILPKKPEFLVSLGDFKHLAAKVEKLEKVEVLDNASA